MQRYHAILRTDVGGLQPQNSFDDSKQLALIPKQPSFQVKQDV